MHIRKKFVYIHASIPDSTCVENPVDNVEKPCGKRVGGFSPREKSRTVKMDRTRQK